MDGWGVSGIVGNFRDIYSIILICIFINLSQNQKIFRIIEVYYYNYVIVI